MSSAVWGCCGVTRLAMLKACWVLNDTLLTFGLRMFKLSLTLLENHSEQWVPLLVFVIC